MLSEVKEIMPQRVSFFLAAVTPVEIRSMILGHAAVIGHLFQLMAMVAHIILISIWGIMTWT
jgi:hypothetical protein